MFSRQKFILGDGSTNVLSTAIYLLVQVCSQSSTVLCITHAPIILMILYWIIFVTVRVAVRALSAK